MSQRIFLAINLPEEIKEKLVFYQKYFPLAKERWTKKENLHLTLFFLGNCQKEEVEKLKNIVLKVASLFNPFKVKLQEIILAPSQGKPRMIWATVEKNDKLLSLYQELKNLLSKEKSFFWRLEKREYFPHITLARFKKEKVLRAKKLELNLEFEAKSIDIMESQLSKKGANYFCLFRGILKKTLEIK